MRAPWLLVALLGCGGSDAPGPSPSPVVAEPAAQADCPVVERPSLSVRLSTRLNELAEKCDDVGRASTRDASLDATIGGKWEGYFEYEGAYRPRGLLVVDFLAKEGVLTGIAVETEGDATMKANLTGDVYGSRQVVWMGTYFFGGSHSVLWSGTLDDAGKRIEGHWRLHEVHGTFVLARP